MEIIGNYILTYVEGELVLLHVASDRKINPPSHRHDISYIGNFFFYLVFGVYLF